MPFGWEDIGADVAEVTSGSADTGAELLQDLYDHLNPMPFGGAAHVEKDLAEALRAAGYTVTGGH